MAVEVDKNILYGGPEPPLIDDESKSFGEVILKKLATHGNNVMFVSSFSFLNVTFLKMMNKQTFLFLNSDRWNNR